MQYWLEAAAAALFACAGIVVGNLFSRLSKPYWTFGYFIPLASVLVYAVASQVPALSFVPPVSWMMMGRKKFAVMGFIAALILTTPLSRLPGKRDRGLVCLLMAVMVFRASVWPFIVPAFEHRELSQLRTRIVANGICLQTTDYTCGPAAAVTALRQLGLSGAEGELAILSETSSAAGTPPDMLADALQREYGRQGLVAECRPFHDMSELKQAGPTLAVIKYSFMVDQWVAVLQVTNSAVIVGDPLTGKVKIQADAFQREWRFIGVVLRLKP